MIIGVFTPNGIGPWPWFVAIVVGSALRYSLLIMRGEPRLFELSIWLFVYLFMGLAPLIQIRTGSYPETTPGMLIGLEGRSAAVIIVGTLAFAFGAWLWRGKATATQVRDISAHATYRLACCALLFSWWYIHATAGSLFADRDTYGMARAALWPNPVIGSLVGALSTTPLLVSAAATIVLYKRDRKAGVRLLIVAEIITLAVVVNPISGARIAFGSVFLSLIAMLGGFATSRGFRISAIVVVTCMVLVFPYADAFRHGAPSGNLFGKGDPVQAMTKGDFDSFAQITNTVSYVDNHGVTYGRQALGVALFWVPRSLWSGKAEDTGVLLARDRQYGFTNLSAPLWSELFINGGWLVLMLGMGGLGCILRRQDQIRIASTNVGVSGSILPFSMLIVLRGSLLQAIAGFAAVILFSSFVSRRPSELPVGGDDAILTQLGGREAARSGPR